MSSPLDEKFLPASGPRWQGVRVRPEHADPFDAYLASLPPELRALYESPAEDVIVVGDDRVVHLDELLAVLSEQVTGMPRAGDGPVRRDRYGPALLAAAWRATVFGQVRAVLTLLEAELWAEAQANARSALEHAIALQELALAADDDELEALLEKMAREVQKRLTRQLEYLDRLNAASGGTHDALLAAARQDQEAHLLSRGEKQSRGSRSAWAMFERVAPGGHLYSIYSRLSESTHAGLGSAAPYVASALRTEAAALKAPDPVAWAETAALLCWSCWAADDAMLRFLEDGTDLAARHVELLARVGLAPG